MSSHEDTQVLPSFLQKMSWRRIVGIRLLGGWKAGIPGMEGVSRGTCSWKNPDDRERVGSCGVTVMRMPRPWVNRTGRWGWGRSEERQWIEGEDPSTGSRDQWGMRWGGHGQVQGGWVWIKNCTGSYHVPSLCRKTCGCGWKRAKTSGQKSWKSESGEFFGNCAIGKRKMGKLTQIQSLLCPRQALPRQTLTSCFN